MPTAKSDVKLICCRYFDFIMFPFLENVTGRNPDLPRYLAITVPVSVE